MLSRLKKFFAVCSLFVVITSVNYIEVIVGRDYFNKVKFLIDNAKKSIHIIMFKMRYYKNYPDSPTNLLIESLINAHRRGVDVHVLLEISDFEKKLAVQNMEVGTLLKRHGVKVYYDPLHITTHDKLIIIDDNITIIGSTNWTYHALAKNNESSLLIKSAELANYFKDYFYKILR